MRFAGSNPAIQAMGVVSGYNPNAISNVGQQGRSLQTQASIKGQTLVDETSILNEGRLEAAKYGIQANEAQVPGLGETIGMSVLDGLGNFAGPIASGLNSPTVGVDRTSPGKGIPGSVAPMYRGEQRPYYGPAF